MQMFIEQDKAADEGSQSGIRLTLMHLMADFANTK